MRGLWIISASSIFAFKDVVLKNGGCSPVGGRPIANLCLTALTWQWFLWG